MDVFEKGGYVMLIIIACSFVALTIIIERWRYYRKADKQGVCFLQFVGSRHAHTSQDDILAAVMLRLEQHLYILVTIATIAPLLGLLGTVMGMIKTFHAASLSGVGDPRLLAEGISEALYNTAGGLCVTVPCIIANNYFRAWAERILEHLIRHPQQAAEVVERGDIIGNEI